VEQLGDDGFDHLKEVLSGSPSAQQKINGLSLLLRGGGHVSERSGTIRLPEVFDVASKLVMDPDPAVRGSATRMIVGILGLLKQLEKPLTDVGGGKRVREILQHSLEGVPRELERKLVEKALAEIEPTLDQ
jgi:hypothetical protein